jgi:hypothetical protein
MSKQVAQVQLDGSSHMKQIGQRVDIPGGPYYLRLLRYDDGTLVAEFLKLED